MAAKDNPYYVQPATPDISPIMQGLTSVMETNRKENYKKRMKDSMMEAFNSGDPQKVAGFVAEYPEARDGMVQAMGFKNKATKLNYMQTLRDVLSTRDMYGSGEDSEERNSKVVDLLEKRNEYVRSHGGTPQDTEEGVRNFMNDPEGFLQRAELGYSAMASPQEIKTYQTMKAGGEVDPEFMKEERKTASQDVRAFNTKARAMRTSYGQLQGLADQARGGDRGAKNAMVVTLARLISPGIVTEKEAGALSGGQNTMQFIMENLLSKSDSAEFANVMKGFDPYGESFDSDAVLKIGESVVASGRQPLIDMYEGSRKRAERAKMPSRAFDTNFGDNENYGFLQSFAGATEGGRLPAAEDAGAPVQAPAQAQTQPAQPAPAGAIETLMAIPQLRDAFLNTYGYLPEGM